MVANQILAGTYTTSAEDAAVVIDVKPGMRGVDREGRPVRLHGPIGHVFMVGGILQFAIAVRGRAVHAEMVAFAEDQGKHEFSSRFDLFAIG